MITKRIYIYYWHVSAVCPIPWMLIDYREDFNLLGPARDKYNTVGCLLKNAYFCLEISA